MSLLCVCPIGAEIADIPLNACIEDIGQIQKVIFQRIYSTGTTRNFFDVDHATVPEDPTLLATWTPYLAVSDGTKVVQSPFLQNPESEAGAARVYGGGNGTLDGIELIVGREPTTFTSMVLQSQQDTIAAMKEIACEEVGVYLIDEHGRIWGDDKGGSDWYPIPVRKMFIGDKKLGGLEEPDSNAIEWSFLPDWSDNIKGYTPTDFNALTDLVTP